MKKLIHNTLQLINQKESRELFKTYVEIAIDAHLNWDAVRNIPIVNTLTDGANLVISIRDRLFLNKMKVFIEKLEDIPEKKIQEFLDGIEKKQKIEKLGEQVLTIVEQADSSEKTKILGIIFKMYIEKRIDKYEFDFLTFCTNKAFIEDLYALDPFHVKNGVLLPTREEVTKIDEELGQTLFSLGLASMDVKNQSEAYLIDERDIDHVTTTFWLNNHGKLLRLVIQEFNDIETIKTNQN